jgi:hypothetical protein
MKCLLGSRLSRVRVVLALDNREHLGARLREVRREAGGPLSGEDHRARPLDRVEQTPMGHG